jgi:hypothetical protein
MTNEDKYKEGLIRIIKWARSHKDAMDDSFSLEFACDIENIALMALGYDIKQSSTGNNLNAYDDDIIGL